jgi:2-oxoglutarate/2-oxoacid ferredoxin oxidoreductase subunit alpha
VIEQNRDGQLRSLLINECDVDGRRLESILHYDGLPMAAGPLVAAVRDRIRKGAAA